MFKTLAPVLGRMVPTAGATRCCGTGCRMDRINRDLFSRKYVVIDKIEGPIH